MDSLSDRVVLITGATGALGRAVTQDFAQTKARLVLTARSEVDLQRLVAQVGLPMDGVAVIPADATQVPDVSQLVEGALSGFGRLDVLLNCAGGWSGGQTVAETAVEDWDSALALNLRTAFLLSRAVLPAMTAAGWGRIVHVSSRTAVEPRAKQAAYVVAKVGLIALTDVLAAEVKGSGVTVNVIVPAIIDTPANREAMPKGDPTRWVPPQHIAATMRFLCSDAAASVNGAHIALYGAL